MVLGGIFYVSMVDNVYKGMFILKGSIIIVLLWSSKFCCLLIFVFYVDFLVYFNEVDFFEFYEFCFEWFMEE